MSLLADVSKLLLLFEKHIVRIAITVSGLWNIISVNEVIQSQKGIFVQLRFLFSLFFSISILHSGQYHVPFGVLLNLHNHNETIHIYSWVHHMQPFLQTKLFDRSSIKFCPLPRFQGNRFGLYHFYCF